MAKGILGNDRDSSNNGGGLIIIAPQEATVDTGHPSTYVCQECIDAWNEKTKVLARTAAKAMAVDAEIVENKNILPDSLESAGETDETDVEDDVEDDDPDADELDPKERRWVSQK